MVPVEADRVKLIGHVEPRGVRRLHLVVLSVPGRQFTECEIYGQANASGPIGWYAKLRTRATQSPGWIPNVDPTIYEFTFGPTEPPINVSGMTLSTVGTRGQWQLKQVPVIPLRAEGYDLILDGTDLWVGEARR